VQFLDLKLQAPSARLGTLRRFYTDELGFPDAPAEGASYAFQVGRTALAFTPVAPERPFYHFAMRLPRNRFAAAGEWVAGVTELLADPESGETTFRFDNWNAEAFYAHDPCGNIVEFIAHHELPEETAGLRPFSADEFLGVCELGLVGGNPRQMAGALETLGISLWDGTLEDPGRLAFMGDREGVLILSTVGRGWMPTGRPARVHRVEALVSGKRNAEVTPPETPHRISTTTANSHRRGLGLPGEGSRT
jgi:hypothetical protein